MKAVNLDGCEGYFVTEDAKVFSNKRGSLIELIQRVEWQYYAVPLVINGHATRRHVHRLVALTYIDNPENKPWVNHKDGNKLNNNVENLEWSTRQENTDHAVETGLWKPSKGEDNGRSLLNSEQVRDIYQRLSEGESNISLAREFGVEVTTISSIKRKVNWQDITADLPEITIKHKSEKCDTDTVVEICKKLEAGEKPTPIAKALSVPVDLVYDIKRRRGFKNISIHYKW